MIDNVQRLQFDDFLPLKMPRLDYAKQTSVSSERVNLTTACAIHYGLNVGMVNCYLKGKYFGESWDADAILLEVSPHINSKDCKHIKRIIDQGCPSHLDFKEDYENKHYVLQKGNQQTFLQQPEVTTKMMNKEEKNSQVLPFKIWVVYFPPIVEQPHKEYERSMKTTVSSLTLQPRQVRTRSSSITKPAQIMRQSLTLEKQKLTSLSISTIGKWATQRRSSTLPLPMSQRASISQEFQPMRWALLDT